MNNKKATSKDSIKNMVIVPSAASGAAGHDIWVEVMKFGVINTAITAPPYLMLNACAASPSLCSTYINYKRN